MPTALRIYNIFCWNSSPIKKPTELHWYAHTGGWQPKPAMLKAQAQTIFIILKNAKMQTKKMSLANIQGKLSRAEMKDVMAGTGKDSLACSLQSCGGCYSNCKCPASGTGACVVKE